MKNQSEIAVLCLSHSPQMAQDVAKVQGRVFREGFERVAAAVKVYDPTLVVFFGPDHMRALAGIAPCFTLVEEASGYGDWGSLEGEYDVPHEKALELGRHLAEAGIDIAMAPALKLDHGFGQSTGDLFGSLSAVPTLPIIVNCVDRPMPPAFRAAALGTAVGDYLRSATQPAERVLIIGSGGISHAPPSLVPGARDLSEQQRQALITENIAKAAEAINPEWDQNFMMTLGSEEWRSIAAMTAEDWIPAGTGGAEARTWIASAFAGNMPLESVVYEPIKEWITGMGIVASANLLTR